MLILCYFATQRKKTLLPQYLDRNRSGGITDRRFGEDNPTLTPEERALQRFTLERQRKASKNSLFNLGDNDDDNEGEELLTHSGQSLADVRGSLPDQEDFFKKSSEQAVLAARDDQADAAPQRKKSRAEIMEEVIAKSKAYKVSQVSDSIGSTNAPCSMSVRKLSMRTRMCVSSSTPISLPYEAY